MRILLLRHGATAGNLKKRYVGCRTDEGITEEEKKRLTAASETIRFPVRTIYVSPMRRCLETEAVLFQAPEYGTVPVVRIPGLSECDFGIFEGKNYQELSESPEYQRFIDSGGTDGFPGGEAVHEFKDRCKKNFGKLVRSHLEAGAGAKEALVFVVHGGTIMAVLEAFARPQKDYYSWHVNNGCGYLCETFSDRSEPFGFCLYGCEKTEFIL